MPGIISNPLPPSQARATSFAPKLSADEVELPFSALQCPVTTARVCGLSKVASQPVTGPYVRPNQHTQPHHSKDEAVCKPRLPENLGFSPERAVPDYGSSGSDHDPSSVSLFAMVHDFIENNSVAGDQQGGVCNGSKHLTINKESSKINGAVKIAPTIQSLALCKDSIEEMLLQDTKLILNSVVTEVGHVCDDGKVPTMAHSCLKRTVMSRLQKMGYAAAICKSKWDHFGGIPAGDYEYIDVLHPGAGPLKTSERLLVDINLRAEFEIARPTDEFIATWQLLPSVFVGRADRLKQIVQIMSEATKQSMHAKGLHLPPWRKSAYVKAKWFSSYKRTANITSARSCREGEYGGNSRGLVSRVGGLDVKRTSIIEMMHRDAGSKLVSGVGRDLSVARKERDEITVLMTEWQPPAMVPRCTLPGKQGRMMGLTSLLNAQASKTLVQAV